MVEFWQTEESKLFLNPRLEEGRRKRIEKAVQEKQSSGVVWLKSSGTESSGRGDKLVCLRKSSILVAAQAVNDFFSVNEQDVWLNPLPNFHIGGLSVSARCFLSKSTYVEYQGWDPSSFVQFILDQGVTVTSLVPTQIFDLVQAGLKAPSSLRFILVGGGALSEKLYIQARDLGWPLLPSYGMTETSAVIASARLDSLKENQFPTIYALPHVEWVAQGDKWALRGDSLFEGYLWVDEAGESVWEESVQPFVSDDRLDWQQGTLKVLGRESELIKVLGESVNLKELHEKISSSIDAPFVIIPRVHPRKGFELYLVKEKACEKVDLSVVNASLMPYERLTDIVERSQLPRTELGKIHLSQVKEDLEQSLYSKAPE